MACALGLIQRIVWDPWGDEGGIIVVAGAIAVEADFPRCGEAFPSADAQRTGDPGEMQGLTSRERNHLIPLGREIRLSSRLQDPFVKNFVPGFAVRFLHLAAYLFHAVRGHEVCVSFVGLIDVDLFEPALSIMASAEVFHLGEDFDHSC